MVVILINMLKIHFQSVIRYFILILSHINTPLTSKKKKKSFGYLSIKGKVRLCVEVSPTQIKYAM